MDAETCNQLAWQYLHAGESQLALQHALRAHELKRGNLDYLNTLGVAYGEAGQLDLAEATFRKLVRRKPGDADALVNLAKALEKQERLEEAAKHYARAAAIAPAFPRLQAARARLCLDRGDVAGAKALLEETEVDGENRAMLLAEARLESGETGALQGLADEVARHPEWPLARASLAHALLASGKWRDGWRHYSTRLEPAPRSFAGERILVRSEQGIGDVLFFLRFAPLLREREATLALALRKDQEKLRPLLPTELLHAGAPFGREMAMEDLPALIETDATPPAFPLWITEDEKRAARQRLAALGAAPYLAVTWRAGTDTARARAYGAERKALPKAVPPALLGGALRGRPGTVVLLQRGARPEDAPAFSDAFGAPVQDLSALGDDLRALLGVLAVIDEYVCVSNANVHMLAGLGRTAKVLVPQPPEWRWMREGAGSPWFPGFALYRQPVSRDWGAPLARLRQDLIR